MKPFKDTFNIFLLRIPQSWLPTVTLRFLHGNKWWEMDYGFFQAVSYRVQSLAGFPRGFSAPGLNFLDHFYSDVIQIPGNEAVFREPVLIFVS